MPSEHQSQGKLHRRNVYLTDSCQDKPNHQRYYSPWSKEMSTPTFGIYNPSHTTKLFYHSEYIRVAPSDCWTSHTTMEPTAADSHQQQPNPQSTPRRGHLEQKDQHNTYTPSTPTMEYPLFQNPPNMTKSQLESIAQLQRFYQNADLFDPTAKQAIFSIPMEEHIKKGEKTSLNGSGGTPRQ